MEEYFAMLLELTTPRHVDTSSRQFLDGRLLIDRTANGAKDSDNELPENLVACYTRLEALITRRA